MSNLHLNFRIFIISIVLFVSSARVLGQARLVLNGAKINISQGANLVINNSAANAITRIDGHIISEGQSNVIKWNIGTTTGTYTVPFGYGDTDYIPVSFTKTAGTGAGHFLFATYHTDAQNSNLLPTGVTNINGVGGTNNSAFEIDRFWRVDAQSYTVRPGLTNLLFTYLDIEHTPSGNTITESGLTAKRYNSTSNSWTDNFPTSTLNATSNTVTVTSVAAANLFAWWTLGTLGKYLYWVAPSSSTSNSSANWASSAGGAGNAGVPTNIDVAIFDGSMDANCALNAPLTTNKLIVDPGYSGTISQGASTITVNHSAVLSGGVFTGGSANININGDITISGTAFTSTSGELDVKNNFTFSTGSFQHNNGTVKFSGTSGTTQVVSGSSAANFNNITVTNTTATPGLSIQSNQNLSGVLTLANNVSMDADGPSDNAILKLISTADSPTRDGSIAALPANAQITGNVTVQRFMTKEGRSNGNIYRYISAPVQGAPVSDLQNEIPVMGSFTNRSVCGGCGTTQSMFLYRESVITDIDRSGGVDKNDGYLEFPDVINTETFEPGRGYSILIKGSVLSSTAWDLRGTVLNANSTPVSFPVTFTPSTNSASDGWNLVGNPFASTIDWNAASGWTKTNLEGTIYVTDNGSSTATQYASWNGVTGTNGGSRYIAIGQAFWVKANAASPALSANESIKSAGQQTTFFRQGSLSDLIRITMTKGDVRDEAVIHFREDATQGFDQYADAKKWMNGTFNLSSLSESTRYAINSLGSLDCTTSIRLGVENSAPGDYIFNFSEYESFDGSVTITLTDNFTDSVFNVLSGNSYNFAVTSNANSYGFSRFKINFATLPVDSTFSINAADICEGENASISIDNTQGYRKYQVAVNDLLVGNPLTGNNAVISTPIPAELLNEGENIVTVKSYTDHCSASATKQETFVIVKPVTPSLIAAKTCQPGSLELSAEGAPADGHYNWYESALAELPLGEHTGTFTTPFLNKTKTFYASIVSALGCESERLPVKATITQFAPAEINATNDLLVSNYNEGNQWYYNGELVASGSQTITPDKTGSYKVLVSIQGCETSASYEYTKPAPGEVKTETISTVNTPVPAEEQITTSETELTLQVNILPNPVQNDAVVELFGPVSEMKEVRLINSIGQVFLTQSLHEKDGKKTALLQLGSYPAGIYIVQILGHSSLYEYKLLKQ